MKKVIPNLAIALGILVLALPILRIVLVSHARSVVPGRLVAERELIVWKKDASTIDKANGPAKITLKLTNDGDEVVNILSVESGCGCTKPISSQMRVTPGSTTNVELAATPPPVGSRDVKIVVNTDSKIQKYVEMTIRLFSERKPPYVINASGDLNFGTLPQAEDVRNIVVYTAQSPMDMKTPILQTSLSCIDYELIGKKSMPYSDQKSEQVSYTYKISLKGEIPEDMQLGDLNIIDPWDDSTAYTFKVIARKYQPIRLSPKSLVLRRGEGRVIIVSDKELDDINFKDISDDKLFSANFYRESVTRNITNFLYTYSIKQSSLSKSEQSRHEFVITSTPKGESSKIYIKFNIFEE